VSGRAAEPGAFRGFDSSFVHQKLASGEEREQELLRTDFGGFVAPTGWSPDGRFLLYAMSGANTFGSDLWVLPPEGGKPVPFMRTEFNEDQGAFSPNGRWIAYVSDQSGANEVYVREFTSDFSSGAAGVGGSIPISRGGGTAPRWRGDGRELLYRAPDEKMMAVEVMAGPEFSIGMPTDLFLTPSGTIVGDVTADGGRFLLAAPVGPSASAPFTVVLNWTTGLKK